MFELAFLSLLACFVAMSTGARLQNAEEPIGNFLGNRTK